MEKKQFIQVMATRQLIESLRGYKAKTGISYSDAVRFALVKFLGPEPTNEEKNTEPLAKHEEPMTATSPPHEQPMKTPTA